MAYEEAREELIDQSERAHFVKIVETEGGTYELWRGPRPHRARFRVVDGGGGLPQLVTVMKGRDPGWR